MSEDDENLERATDLEPARSHPNHNQYIQALLSSGAGANAGSTLAMTFVAADPLSELVWSPQKGLSLKCADGSFSEKKSSFVWGGGPRNVISKSQIYKPVTVERNSIPMASFSGNGEDPLKDKITSNSKMEERNSAEGITLLQENKCLISNEKEVMCKTANLTMPKTPETIIQVDEQKLEVAQDDPSSSPNYGKSDGNVALEMEDVLVSEGNIVKKASSSYPGCAYPMEKPESTAENDVRTLLTENNDLTAKAADSISAREVENSLQNEGRLPANNYFMSKLSPTNSEIRRYKIKGKAKALSDGNVSGKMQNDEDDSHGSAESCNSAGRFSTGKKRWNDDQEFVVESKRVKRNLQDVSPVSSLFAKKDSSFMNWISNMMKGFFKSNEDGAPSRAIALALTNPVHGPGTGQDSHDQAVNMSYKNQEHGCRTMGFQSIFQSLYCPRTNTQVNISLNSNYQIRESEGPKLGSKICDLDATPVASQAKTGNLCKRFLTSNEKLNEPIPSSGESLEAQPNDLSVRIAAGEELKMSVSSEKKAPCQLETGEEKDGASLSSSGKNKTSDDANAISELPSAAKTDHVSGILKSSWITRFTKKDSGRFQISGSKCPGEASDFTSPDGVGLNSPQHRHLDSEDHKGSETRNFPDRESIQNCATNNDSSFGFNTSKGLHEEKFMCKLNPGFPSPGLKNFEAGASISATTLDGFKHIMPSNETNPAAHSMTCFFCGTKGHRLQDCPGVADSVIENLSTNFTSYDKAEDLPRLCIRCLQFNHWANDCPSAPPRRQAACNSSLNSESCPNEIQLNVRNDVPKSSSGGDSLFPGAGGPALHEGNGSRMEKDLNLNLKIGETSPPEISRFSKKLFDKDTDMASKGSSKFKEPKATPVTDFVTKQTSDVPKGVFDAVKQLRLSRTDILKWMNSKSPFTRLDGFFLRLRLGNREKGLGGTGYYVACITGENGESRPRTSTNPIRVNVGGIECLVESQYISNHEFLEEEIRAWWTAVVKGGEKVPSEEEFRSKVREKMMVS